MERLKLVTLTLLIPLGWLVNDAAAHPLVNELAEEPVLPVSSRGCGPFEPGADGAIDLSNQADLPHLARRLDPLPHATDQRQSDDGAIEACGLELDLFDLGVSSASAQTGKPSSN